MKTPLKCWVDAAVGWGVFPLGGQHVGNGTDFTAKAHKQGKKKVHHHMDCSLLTQLTQVKPIFAVFRLFLHLKDVTLNMVCGQLQNPGLY